MTGFKIKALIFDLDGLVLDSETTYISAWRQAAVEMGCRLDDAFCKSLSGMHGASVERRLLEHCGGEFDIDGFNRLSREIWSSQVREQGIPVKKGFFSVLKAIERLDLPFCLATNSRRRDAEFCLNVAGLGGVFPTIVARDDVLHGKPAADIFIAAATELSTLPSDCLVLEDSPVGVAGALAAGAPCVYVPSVYPLDSQAAAGAIAVMADLDQVADFILASAQALPDRK